MAAKKYQVTFRPGGASCNLERGETLLKAADRAGIALRADCGGKGLCGKCLVRVEPAEALEAPSAAEERLLERPLLEAGLRLACQARVMDDLRVEMETATLDAGHAASKQLVRGRFPCDPLQRRRLLPRLGASPQQADLDELAQRLDVPCGLAALRDLAALQDWQGELTLVEEAGKRVQAVKAGRHPRSLGLAFDLGTTTVAAYLCDLATGELLTSAGLANPQRRLGEDVISRISFCEHQPDGLHKLRALAVEALNAAGRACLYKAEADREDVDATLLVGNTTMQQILAGLHPRALGRFPFLPATREPLELPANELGLFLHHGVRMHLFPVAAGFLGGDLLAALLAQAPPRPSQSCLLVDIGTNGELALVHGENIWATSCATGPALEGAHISCGMRAMNGAIHRVRLAADGEGLKIEVLGQEEGARPAGVCGSGLVDALACLRRNGTLRPDGRLISPQGEPLQQVVLVPAQRSAGQCDLTLTQLDVRQVQLAKAALAVGIDYLFEQAGLDKVERTVLTGAFGAGFDWHTAVTIGILPPRAAAGRVETVPNAAGQGAVMALLDQKLRRRAAELARRIQVVELNLQPGFNQRFVAATAFPDPVPRTF